MKDESLDYFKSTVSKLKQFNNWISEESKKKCQIEIENVDKIKNELQPDLTNKSSFTLDKALLDLKRCQYPFEFDKTKYNNIHGFATKLFTEQTNLCIKDCQDRPQSDKETQTRCVKKCVEDTEKYTIWAYSNYIIPELQGRSEHI